MQALIVFASVLAVASAGLLHVAPYAAIAPGPVSSQYHAQDELGQYSYGYAGGPSAKSEVKTFDGVTRGAYSYIDANGLLQQVQYVSDPVNGFRVAATNLPVAPAAAPAPVALSAAPAPVQDTPEVAAAKAAHAQAHAEAAARAAAASPAPAAPAPAVLAAPAPVQDTPEVAAAKAAHAQAHAVAAARAASAPVVYAAPASAFYAAAPLHFAAAPAGPIPDTLEVALAKAAHAQAHAEALARSG